MIGRVIEIASDGRHLARHRGFMTVSERGAEIGRVPLDDIGVLLCNARGLTYSNGLMAELARRGVAVVLCGERFLPTAWLMPMEGNHAQSQRMRLQTEAPKPLRKRAWQAAVRAKIRQQAAALELVNGDDGGLKALARKVRSGDPDNVEARAARRYWPALFGADFRRDRYGEMPNPLLNYGYAVLRAATARAIASAGLHPSLGIHHRSRTNTMPLADDLMEPFRPMVDVAAHRLMREGADEVSPDAKRALAGVLAMDMKTDRGTTPLQTCVERAAQSLAQSFESGVAEMAFPDAPIIAPPSAAAD